jgi:hypothetical protein
MDPKDIRRWARGRDRAAAPSELAVPVAAALPPSAAALPPPPPGFVYAWMPHLQAFVPVVAPGIAADPSQAAAPSAPAPAVSWRPTGGNPRPAPIRTCKLVAPGNVDKYAELLAQTPELTPAQAPHLFGGLQPQQGDMETLIANDPGVGISGLRGSRYLPPHAADPMNRVTISSDPGEDAFPSGTVARAQVKPLRELVPGAAPQTG